MKKKPFTDRNPDVLCANELCAQVHGKAGTDRMPIKQNVIDRAPDNQTEFFCYDCSIWIKSGKKITKSIRKKMERERRAKRPEPKVLTAGEEV